MAFNGVKFITPRVRLAFPKLNKPDTKWKPEGEYTARGVLLEPLPDAVQAKVRAMLDAFVEEKRKELVAKKQAAKAKGLTVNPVFLKPEVDRESGDETGALMVAAKMKAVFKNKKTGETVSRKPVIFDAKGKQLTSPPEIWGGTEGKIAVTAAPYHMESSNTIGVTLYLDAFQIIKLVSRGAGDAKSMGFAEEEGYEGSDAPASFTDESNGSTSGTDPEDF